MKKIILLMGLILIPLVMAINISDGDIITQQQLNAVDVENMTLRTLADELKCEKLSPYMDGFIVVVPYRCLMAERYNDTSYLIKWDVSSVDIQIFALWECIREEGKQYCIDLVLNTVRNKVKSNLIHYKEVLIEFQNTPTGDEVINDLAGDIFDIEG